MLNRVLYLEEPVENQTRKPLMKFCLTYEGPVPSSQSHAGREKMVMRKHFHRQMKYLWSSNTFLRSVKVPVNTHPDDMLGRQMSDFNRREAPSDERIDFSESVAKQYQEFGYRFVPLIRKTNYVVCSLKIRLLRSDDQFSPVSAGDLDNRVKTIIDSLKKPSNQSECSQYTTPEEGEDPFFVLLEDDKYLSHLEVECTQNLKPDGSGNHNNKRWSQVWIDVDVKPVVITMDNVPYLGG